MIIQQLKIWPEYYQAVQDNRKTFEIRFDDRDYAVGDYLVLNEWNPNTESYTGRRAVRRVTYVTSAPEYLKRFYVVMGMQEVGYELLVKILKAARNEYSGTEVKK